MLWYKTANDLIDHPKVYRLAAKLGIDETTALGFVHRLFSFTAKHAPDGKLAKYDAREIELAMRWTGEAQKMWCAMIDAGFVEDAPGDAKVHDWWEENGRQFKEIQRSRKRRRDRGRDAVGTRSGRGTDGRTDVTNMTDERKDLFARFWSDYPNKVNKKDTLRIWSKMPTEDQTAAHREIPRHKAGRKWIEGFVMAPDRYLRGRHWEDATETPRAAAAIKECPKSPTGRHGGNGQDWWTRDEGKMMECHFCGFKKPKPGVKP